MYCYGLRIYTDPSNFIRKLDALLSILKVKPVLLKSVCLMVMESYWCR
ncbi:hypothetical protein SAMN05421543_1662 [Alicyclobacillus macrosporangiidus]|uniref:Uncharacterized protein n=1 Tax=Alicyclobacillus macrosporangiidus TaxID=392015 RepID=A0A1I7LJH8_9BACL|nr:hypothetical protein SAMN05421543_1662 [Alicyclobacillus macrosporangiidus]